MRIGCVYLSNCISNRLILGDPPIRKCTPRCPTIIRSICLPSFNNNLLPSLLFKPRILPHTLRSQCQSTNQPTPAPVSSHISIPQKAAPSTARNGTSYGQKDFSPGTKAFPIQHLLICFPNVRTFSLRPPPQMPMAKLVRRRKPLSQVVEEGMTCYY